ncbi:MAG: hypothetical protein KJZ69_05145 [Phycisphaerales bacterium]|nr:hypothetical protein [Phycisphaerales bacterium]
MTRERSEQSDRDPRLEALDAELQRHLAPGAEARLVAGRVFEASRGRLARAGERRPLRLVPVEDEGASMLPSRSSSAWPVMAALAAMVVLATVITMLFSVQSARNNEIVAGPGAGAEVAAAAEYVAIDGAFESEFTLATSTLLSDITASVDSLVTTGDEWAFGSLSNELQIATTSLWEEMESF